MKTCILSQVLLCVLSCWYTASFSGCNVWTIRCMFLQNGSVVLGSDVPIKHSREFYDIAAHLLACNGPIVKPLWGFSTPQLPRMDVVKTVKMDSERGQYMFHFVHGSRFPLLAPLKATFGIRTSDQRFSSQWQFRRNRRVFYSTVIWAAVVLWCLVSTWRVSDSFLLCREFCWMWFVQCWAKLLFLNNALLPKRVTHFYIE